MTEKYPFPSRLYQFVIVLVVAALACAVIFALLPFEPGNIAAICLFVFVIVAAINKKRGTKLYRCTHWALGRSEVRVTLFAVIALTLLLFGFFYPLKYLISGFPEKISQVSIGLIALSAMAPFVEEPLFRWTLLNGLLARYKAFVAILISSLAFMLAHSPHTYFSSFIVGLVLGYVFYRTKSITACIAVHLVTNLLSIFLLSRITYFRSMAFCVALVALSCVCTAVVAAVLCKNAGFQRKNS